MVRTKHELTIDEHGDKWVVSLGESKALSHTQKEIMGVGRTLAEAFEALSNSSAFAGSRITHKDLGIK